MQALSCGGSSVRVPKGTVAMQLPCDQAGGPFEARPLGNTSARRWAETSQQGLGAKRGGAAEQHGMHKKREQHARERGATSRNENLCLDRRNARRSPSNLLQPV